MLSDYISPGDKLELSALQNVITGEDSKGKRIYRSRLQDIVSEDEIQLVMPTENGRLILLSVGMEYDLCFYSRNGSLYQCSARVKERYKSNNVYTVTMELTSNLRKFQRREYYRLNCVLDMKCGIVTDEQIERMYSVIDDGEDEPESDIVFKDGVIVDISGGGVRFISGEEYEKETKILFMFGLRSKGEHRQFSVIGKIISSSEIEGKNGRFENRVQFLDMESRDREGIIRYIFEEERKIRRKEKY